MLTVPAPAAITASTTSARNAGSVRDASSGENSMSSTYLRARRTAPAASFKISPFVFFSL